MPTERKKTALAQIGACEIIKSERDLFIDQINKLLNRLNTEGLDKVHPFLLALLTFDELLQPAIEEQKLPPDYLKLVE